VRLSCSEICWCAGRRLDGGRPVGGTVTTLTLNL
jgi:hypothetical protein